MGTGHSRRTERHVTRHRPGSGSGDLSCESARKHSTAVREPARENRFTGARRGTVRAGLLCAASGIATVPSRPEATRSGATGNDGTGGNLLADALKACGACQFDRTVRTAGRSASAHGSSPVPRSEAVRVRGYSKRAPKTLRSQAISMRRRARCDSPRAQWNPTLLRRESPAGGSVESRAFLPCAANTAPEGDSSPVEQSGSVLAAQGNSAPVRGSGRPETSLLDEAGRYPPERRGLQGMKIPVIDDIMRRVDDPVDVEIVPGGRTLGLDGIDDERDGGFPRVRGVPLAATGRRCAHFCTVRWLVDQSGAGYSEPSAGEWLVHSNAPDDWRQLLHGDLGLLLDLSSPLAARGKALLD